MKGGRKNSIDFYSDSIGALGGACGASRGNHSKPQRCGTVELCPDMEPKVMQVLWAEKVRREGGPGSDREPTSVPSSSLQHLAGENLSRAQQTRKMHHPWIAGVMESKSQCFICLSVALFHLSRRVQTALQ